MRNFKFLAFALLVMLCFSFACSPSTSTAQSGRAVEKQSVNLRVKTTYRGNQKYLLPISSPHLRNQIKQFHNDAPNDAIIGQAIRLDFAGIVSKLPIVPIIHGYRQSKSYVSLKRVSDVKPPENSVNRRDAPNIVFLC